MNGGAGDFAGGLNEVDAVSWTWIDGTVEWPETVALSGDRSPSS